VDQRGHVSSATLKQTYDGERVSDWQPTTTRVSLTFTKPYWNAHKAKSSATARRNESHLRTEGASFQMRAIWQLSWSEQVLAAQQFGQACFLFAWQLEMQYMLH